MHCNTQQHTAARSNHHTEHNCIATHCKNLDVTHCNPLKYTATRCNTLQHAATCCNTLFNTLQLDQIIVPDPPAQQHIATHCNTLQQFGCNTLQHAAPRCNTLEHAATRCNALHHTATRCNTLQHTATNLRINASQPSSSRSILN